jgi:hypothetical protein
MIDYEEMTRLIRNAKINVLLAIRESLQKHITEGKQMDDFLRALNGFLGIEMDRAAIEQLTSWKITNPLLRSVISR